MWASGAGRVLTAGGRKHSGFFAIGAADAGWGKDFSCAVRKGLAPIFTDDTDFLEAISLVATGTRRVGAGQCARGPGGRSCGPYLRWFEGGCIGGGWQGRLWLRRRRLAACCGDGCG